ncbi:MAG: MurR/RpiR family transcriptional regulator [Catonella sp.]|uniref:MurR/RpiR family transcriptional regulator n=1 Tax=Catonella sp. TaxID=2382125 RepID=UPI003FA11D5A
MALYSKSLLPVIESRYNAFTQAEKVIADFFLSNTEHIDLSAKHMTETLFVSNASLSRFAKKCGFHGYREFVYEYKEAFVEKKETKTAKTVYESYQELLNKTYNLMDETQIARLTNFLYEKKRVIAFGLGSNGYVSKEMESRFMRIGVDIDSIDNPDRIKMQAPFLTPKHLVIGFSLSGETEAVMYLLKKAKEKKATAVLFTSSANGEFKKYCDEVVLVASLKHLNSGNTISPQFPMLLLIDVLYNEYVGRNRLEKDALHNQSVEALKGVGG